MSEYQRFVSYLYEYKNNRKTQNRGFLKAESRNGAFKLEIHIKDAALSPGIPVDVYGYQRAHETLLGVHLGSVQSGNGSVNCRIESPATYFSSLRGIVLLCNHVFSYASAWDDLPIEPDKFSTSRPEPKPAEPESEFRSESESESKSEFSPEAESDSRSESESEFKPDSLPEPDSKTESDSEPELTAEEISSSDSAWEAVMEQYESFNPFTDGFITECVKIDLKDLPALRQERWMIGSNPFIAHAYEEHQHFILGHICSNDQNLYIFGVPGTYHPKEKLMAEIYGFPYFKATQGMTETSIPFGYWYRPLD